MKRNRKKVEKQSIVISDSDSEAETNSINESEEESDESEEEIEITPKKAKTQQKGRDNNINNNKEKRNKDPIEEEEAELKPNHQKLPLWVTSDGNIFLESFSPYYAQVLDFVVAIAEPVYRTNLIHHYKIHKYSLYGAVSIGLSGDMILKQLEKISKVNLPKKLASFIGNCCDRYGRAKMVLHKSGYSIESVDKKLVLELLSDPIIKSHRIATKNNNNNNNNNINNNNSINIDIENDKEDDDDLVLVKNTTFQEELPVFPVEFDRENVPVEKIDEVVPTHYYSFDIDPESIEAVKKRCIEVDRPLLEEYDFRKDQANNIKIELKSTTTLRSYQEKCLSKIFCNGRARSGIIALPCGAGKSLVGVTAGTTVKKPIIVLCTGAVAVEQWKQQFKLWTTIGDSSITRYTSATKDRKWSQDLSDILITTYSMIAYGGKRATDTQNLINKIKNKEWGMMILDEVHVVPANTFRKVISKVRAHTKLGLTATLIREDEMIQDLNFLIGPKLYEANWLDLISQGHIANVQCCEVWCPMTKEFYREYLSQLTSHKGRLLYIMNPIKFRTCQYLIRKHEERGDKILVFSDNIFALKAYALKLNKPMIFGATVNSDRMRIFSQFKFDSNTNTIFLSKVGDNSIDLPEANVIIQISSHFGSRRQEAQRLGRILRPKSGSITREKDQHDAYFYSLVSQDTQEMFYSRKRQQFLIDQGYAFQTIIDIPEKLDNSLHYSKIEEQLELLASVVAADDKEGETENITDEIYGEIYQQSSTQTPTVTRRESSLESISGGDWFYQELNTNNITMDLT